MVYYAYDEINERVAAVVEVEDKFVRAVGDYQEVSNQLKSPHNDRSGNVSNS